MNLKVEKNKDMEETSAKEIAEIYKNQRTFFASQETKSIDFRLQQLKKLKKAILQYEDKVNKALWEDLHKSKEEAFLTETSLLIEELNYHIKSLKKWSQPKKVGTPLQIKPSGSKIYFEPLGIGLIIAPWNYPFQLTINPLIGAISAGCCAVLKPSPDTPNVARVIKEMISEFFPSEYISVVQGGKEANQELFKFPFDVMFFTGSPGVGKTVMKAAAEHLSRVVLELGGKSPCIVDKAANLKIAGKRIAWGKIINAGQTCIAPDYLLVHKDIKKDLLAEISKSFEEMLGDNIANSNHYGRIVNPNAMNRLMKYLDGDIYYGGKVNLEEKYIAPTILNNVKPEDEIMQEEIFGPILPVMEFEEIEQALSYINKNEKPLALYYFGKDNGADQVLRETSSGGACINDTLLHVANHKLPFGGVGNSGMGKYHGKESFLAFTHERGVVNSTTKLDIPLKYPPYKFFGLIKKIVG
ncbi:MULTISPECIES: aldehyde dehydrogenase [Salegentibacter]|jgi:aldehyde dehydrogenase (NAD+)|uniref:Aldehyde dehydrogenase n=1 Tax=Salegentibacter agarivorans TaxID=345907 RepID=A0A1I2PD18_9FLAO|nr:MULTISPECIES: aldehyde dehydrogenase [Salegentibacter]SFG11827.1 aldehyde dehydrogenase (NAD+) [Salegentibacter agarivorans]|tara:strand:+ start:681 stop:2087 length:1407 start_codon:yes stop_codon:yes gene_type:complete